MKKIGYITAAVAVLAVAGLLYFKFWFVFGEGVKAGELNQVVYKGYVFKTYEGRMIQSGLRSSSKVANPTAVQSYEFEFSVADQAVADSLMKCSGKTVELHYREYKGALPWRGQQKYVVDRIQAVRD